MKWHLRYLPRIGWALWWGFRDTPDRYKGAYSSYPSFNAARAILIILLARPTQIAR